MNNLLHDMPVSIRRAMLIRWYICIYPSLSDPAIGYLVACNIAKVNDIMIQAIQLEQWIAQICVGDWQAALQLDLPDAESQLTTFADYRLPQLLRHWGALEYAHTDLARCVDYEIPLEANSAAEISIRAATVVAVEELVKLLTMENTTKTDMARKWTSVQVDWYLWQVGEKLSASNQLAPHHRVRTIYY